MRVHSKKIMLLNKKEPHGIDEHTVLMLHGNNFLDSSQYNNTIYYNSVSADSSISKFGSGSFYFNYRGNYLNITNSNLPNGNSPFTVDFWFYPINIINYNTLLSIGTSGSNQPEGTGGVVSFGASAYIAYYCYGNRIVSANNVVVANTWQHIAFIGNGSDIKLYLNGVQQANTYTYSYNFQARNYYLIGTNVANASGEYFRGYLEEFRISNIVRWTENFTPPTEPYS